MENLDAALFNGAAFIAGLWLLEYGADKFIDNTAIVAKRLNVSPTLVGLLTCGAEWEELVVVAVALSQQDSTLALGNVIGSSIANILASFSLGLLFMKEAKFDRSSKIYGAVLLALTTVFLLFLFTLSATWKWFAGILLVAAFVVYIGSVATLIYKGTLTAPEDDSDDDSDDDDSDSDSSSDDEDSEHEGPDDLEHGRRTPSLAPAGAIQLDLLQKTSARPTLRGSPRYKSPPKPLRHHVTRLLVGLGALILSSYIVAHSAATLGHALGLSGTAVGTTLLSLATTLPEKLVAIVGGVRHQPGIMVANTVGSNIFLVTLCGGVLFLGGDASQITTGYTFFEASVMWVSAAVILVIILGGGRRWMGGVLLCCYTAFLVLELVNGRNLDD